MRAIAPGSSGAREPAQHEQGREPGTVRDDREQCLAPDALGERAGNALLDEPAPDVREPPVAHAGRTGGLARAAGEAAIQMGLGADGHLGALQEPLHEVDAPARTVELVAQELIGRTRRGAEAAVHALAQDGVRGAPVGRVPDEVGEAGLHSDALARSAAGRGADGHDAGKGSPGPRARMQAVAERRVRLAVVGETGAHFKFPRTSVRD